MYICAGIDNVSRFVNASKWIMCTKHVPPYIAATTNLHNDPCTSHIPLTPDIPKPLTYPRLPSMCMQALNDTIHVDTYQVSSKYDFTNRLMTLYDYSCIM